jgi:hypothetical protein
VKYSIFTLKFESEKFTCECPCGTQNQPSLRKYLQNDMNNKFGHYFLFRICKFMLQCSVHVRCSVCQNNLSSVLMWLSVGSLYHACIYFTVFYIFHYSSRYNWTESEVLCSFSVFFKYYKLLETRGNNQEIKFSYKRSDQLNQWSQSNCIQWNWMKI